MTDFGDLQKQLNAVQEKKEVELNIANGLWAQEGHPFLPAFLDTATKMYERKIETGGFPHPSPNPRAKKSTVGSATTPKAKSQDLIGPRVLNAATRLVLVNAIYFKGAWLHPFKKNQHGGPAILRLPRPENSDEDDEPIGQFQIRRRWAIAVVGSFHTRAVIFPWWFCCQRKWMD